MTLAPLRQPKSFESADEVVAALREAGQRASVPARQVLDALFAAEGPLSAERIAAGASPTLEITSVYRNLERFEQLGVVSHVHLGHGPGLYALARDGDREYLVCDGCNRVTSLKPDALDRVREEIKRDFGHVARFSHFAIHGRCEACAGEASAAHPHSHEHSHGDYVHSHPHAHGAAGEHSHEHA
jgi:Fur family ferric uptake transcriptional regulator